MFKRLALVAVILIVGSVAASADTSSNTYTLGPTDTLLTGWTNTLTVTKFDPTLGTLNSVDLSFTDTITGSITVTTTGHRYIIPGAKYTNTMTLERPDTTVLLYVSPLDTVSRTSIYDASWTWSNLSVPATATDNPASAADDALFTGTGSLLLPVISSASQSVATDPTYSSITAQTMASLASLTVQYNYTPAPPKPPVDPTPEPGTLALLGLGLPLGGMWLRRKRQ
jgi:hypothetical protein